MEIKLSNKTIATVHWSFWVIVSLMLIWNVLGSMNLLWQLTADATSLAAFPDTHRAIIEGRPIWATAGFAVGVLLGALGCLLLLLRKSVAVNILIISLVGIIVTMIHTIKIASSTIEFSYSEIFVMIVLPLVVAIFLVWCSKLAKSNGWIT